MIDSTAEVYLLHDLFPRLLQSFWNKVEVLILSLCVGCVLMFFYRLFVAQRMQEQIHDEPQQYHNFQHVIIWDEVRARACCDVTSIININTISTRSRNKLLIAYPVNALVFIHKHLF